ncbi:hypothetical protein CDL15_Pgr022984 [Punica granatum]|uniref:Uncharacterized protein n=1 Tax=Punica granatum TaxID=22663 RepID=A0A218X5D1_PUNGR|nr:hypothetical protein CDL15_Pgr022984 [Punica granatum]
MSSGFSGGGAPEFYAATGGIRPRSATAGPQQQLYRAAQQQFQGIFLDPSASQIAQQPAPPPLNLIGKRTLSEFQQNQALNNLLLRSVRPRTYLQRSPLEFSGALPAQRFGVPLLQQLRPQPINLANGGTNPTNPTPAPAPINQGVETETKMMNRLQELEKALLDDDDNGDAASVITNANSEWSEAIQSLISPTQNPIASSSPSSSSSSSSPSSSVSVPSPAAIISKQSLVEAATAIYDGKNDVAAEILARLSSASNPRGSYEQRLMDYVLSALRARVFPAENSPPVTELFSKDHVLSTQLLYDLSPCFKLGFMAANFAILEAAAEQPAANKLHVVDFDIGQGGQYVNLIHALSTRQAGRPSAMRITAVSDFAGCEERLTAVGKQLSKVAADVRLGFEFRVVNQRPAELTRDSLGCGPDEALAVNFAFKLYRIPDESVSIENPRDELLRRAKALEPRVVTLVEQEMNANTAPFVGRVNEAFGYYGALMESIESTVQRGTSDRARVEEGLSRRVANSLACEGRDRVERCEVFGKWRARMGMAGFGPRPVSIQVVESLKARLSSGNRVNPGFTVKEEGGGVGFGWLSRTLTVASAWR